LGKILGEFNEATILIKMLLGKIEIIPLLGIPYLWIVLIQAVY
jgi:hypothetical protein